MAGPIELNEHRMNEGPPRQPSAKGSIKMKGGEQKKQNGPRL